MACLQILSIHCDVVSFVCVQLMRQKVIREKSFEASVVKLFPTSLKFAKPNLTIHNFFLNVNSGSIIIPKYLYLSPDTD